jgi:recombinational DNA repair protein (RecF pathway)
VSLKSFAAGESYAELYRLLHESLLLLDRLPEEREGPLTVQFLLRFLALSGHAPQLAYCDSCHAAFGSSQAVFLSRQSAALNCGRCASADSLLLPAGGRAYLEGTLSLPLAQAARVGLESEALSRLRKIAFHLVEASLESRLNTLRAGEGIL